MRKRLLLDHRKLTGRTISRPTSFIHRSSHKRLGVGPAQRAGVCTPASYAPRSCIVSCLQAASPRPLPTRRHAHVDVLAYTCRCVLIHPCVAFSLSVAYRHHFSAHSSHPRPSSSPHPFSPSTFLHLSPRSTFPPANSVRGKVQERQHGRAGDWLGARAENAARKE